MVGSADVGSIFGGLGVRKFWVAGRTLLLASCVSEVVAVENGMRFEREDRLLQVACQVSVLALEMTEDALRDASTYCMQGDEPRSLPSVYPAQPTPLPRTTML